MSMPGFVFHFRCKGCGRHSDEYPLYAFPNTFNGALLKPANDESCDAGQDPQLRFVGLTFSCATGRSAAALQTLRVLRYEREESAAALQTLRVLRYAAA